MALNIRSDRRPCATRESHRMNLRPTFAWLLFGATACTMDIGAPKGPAIRVVSDITRTDTIDAKPRTPIVIAVTDGRDGLSRPVTVSISASPTGPGFEHGMIPTDGSARLETITLQPGDGRVPIYVQFGSQEGPASLFITAPELQVSYAIRFTVKPGAPASLTLRPGDTTIVPTEKYTQTAVLHDRAGNTLSLTSPLQVSSTDPYIAISNGQVTGIDFTRAAITVGYNGVQETAMVSVVPMAKLAGISFSGNVSVGTTDGSSLRRYGAANTYNIGWTPDGAHVLYSAQVGAPNGGLNTRIVSLATATGSVTQVVPDTVSALSGTEMFWPSSSYDGNWIYFVVRTGTGGAIWRIHPDGTGAEEVLPSPASLPYAARSSPSLSADGSLLAYVNNGDVRIMNTANGSTITLSGLGASVVRWSGVSNQLAIRGDSRGLYVVNADGSGLRTLATELASNGTLDWSPDGKWLLVGLPYPSALTRAAMVNVQNGLQLPLQLDVGETVAWAPR